MHKGKRPSTIDGYSRAVRRITEYFDQVPDTLTTADFKQYFNSLIQTHSWSIVKPPQVKRIPDILTATQVSDVINKTKQLRYQVFFMALYSMVLRLSEGLSLTIHDIDKLTMLIHVRDGKGGKTVWCQSLSVHS